MLHGYTAGAWMFAEKAMPYFAGRGWHCFAVDLRGHGRSGGQQTVRTARYADYLEDVAHAVEHVTATTGRTPILVGHSLGSVLARETASTHNVPALVLAGFGDLKLGMKGFMGWMMRNFPFRTVGGMMTGRSSRMWSRFEPQYRTLFKGQPRNAVAPWVGRFQAQAESDKVFMDLMGHEIPSHPKETRAYVIAGNRDPVASPKALNALASALNVTPVVVEGAAHDLFLGAHAETALSRISEWLDSVDWSPS